MLALFLFHTYTQGLLLSGFGKFHSRDKNSRRGRNPQTGGELTLDARRVVTLSQQGFIECQSNHRLPRGKQLLVRIQYFQQNWFLLRYTTLMGKHDKQKDHPADDDDFHNEITKDEVSHIFKDHPDDYISTLEELGFVYHDDKYEPDEKEESTAQPKNANQEYLISFFKGSIPLSAQTITVFLEERRSPHPNYPLFRKYFRSGNRQLLSLLLHGLHLYPVLDELLCDLAFYHEFHPVLQAVIDHYLIACEKQGNLEVFGEFVLDFYYATSLDGYDAFHELRRRHPYGTSKRAVIDFLREVESSNNNQMVEL